MYFLGGNFYGGVYFLLLLSLLFYMVLYELLVCLIRYLWVGR